MLNGLRYRKTPRLPCSIKQVLKARQQQGGGLFKARKPDMHGAFGIVESHEASDVANIGIQVLGLGGIVSPEGLFLRKALKYDSERETQPF